MIHLIRDPRCLVIIGAIFSLALGGTAAAGEATSSAMTEKVLDHHLKAFGDRDMAAILADYTEESLILTPDGVVKGQKQLQPLFEAFFADFAKPGAVFEVKQRIIEGEVAYIVWSAETADNIYELGTDTFLVRDGKIAVHSLAAKVTPKGM